MKLKPLIVTLHLLGGLLLLALLVRQAVGYAQAHRDSGPRPLAGSLRFALAGVFALVWLQVALGGWVSTNYAVLACRDFPTCQGSWWPDMAFQPAFELWRPLGMTGAGEAIPFAALTAIHYTHRLVAYALLPLLVALGWALARSGLARQGRWMAGLAAWQLLTGLSNVVLEWPLVAAVAHTGGAAGLVMVFSWAWCESRSARLAGTPHAVPAHRAAVAEAGR